MKNKLMWIYGLAGLSVVIILITVILIQNRQNIQINNFEDCESAGGDIMKSYPRKCAINNNVFTEVIEEERRYISREVEQCMVIRFVCVKNSSAFSDSTGCGCEGSFEDVEVSDKIAEKFIQLTIESQEAIPVEGYDPDLYMGVYPALAKEDFDGTEAIGGKWIIGEKRENELIFLRNENEEISTADGTLTNEGIKKFLGNIAKRLNIQIENEDDLELLIDKISEKKNNYCSEESRNTQACTFDYNPVCGWFYPEKIQCVKYPCAQTYSNSCGACINKDVLYWTQNECPK